MGVLLEWRVIPGPSFFDFRTTNTQALLILLFLRLNESSSHGYVPLGYVLCSFSFTDNSAAPKSISLMLLGLNYSYESTYATPRPVSFVFRGI
jgi:hypothetical protein